MSNDTISEPNSRIFPDTKSGLQVGGGRKAFRDEDGIWYNSIGLESTELHRHVSKTWQQRCVSLDAFMQQVAEDDRLKRDVIKESTVLRVNEALDLADFEGAPLPITKHTLMQLAQMAGVPYSVLQFGMIEENQFFRPWACETLNRKLEAKLDRKDPYLLRLRKDIRKPRKQNRQKGTEQKGTEQKGMEQAGQTGQAEGTSPAPSSNEPVNVLRAIFDSAHLHGHVDNIELLEMLADSFPKSGWNDALASHLVDDRDTIQGNVLVPDYMKSCPDSDYGVGVSFFNSEVGGGLRIAPFLFRAICFNGCIWGRRDSVVKVVRVQGGIDRNQLKVDVKRAVDLALTEGNDLLVQMGYLYDVPVRNVGGAIAYLAREFGLTQEQGRRWYNGYLTETIRTNTPRDTAFGLLQGLTRSAQEYRQSDTRLLLERKASEILTPDLKASRDLVRTRWEKFAEAGAQMPEKKVHQIITLSAAARDML